MTTSLAAWRTRFNDREDECPWPGPRPLRPNDPKRWLCGREDDKHGFSLDVYEHRVVFLVGSSGVGKTSLLRLGLVPALRQQNCIVAMCRDWSGTATFDSPAEYLGKQVAADIAKQVAAGDIEIGTAEPPSDPKVIGWLQRQYADRAVIILDQFEELIRDESDFADKLFGFLAKLTRSTDLRLVVSLRSEHLHELRPLEHQIQSYETSHYYLDEVDKSAAPDVTASGNTPQRTAIKDDAANELARLWADAREEQLRHGSSAGRIGLLHLQAVLYALYNEEGGALITLDALRRLRRRLERSDQDAKVSLFTEALARAVDVKLARCRQVSEIVGVDPYLVEGASVTLSAAVRHLSSAGFKLVRDAEELAEVTIGGDLDNLRWAIAESRCGRRTEPDGALLREQEDALFQVLTDDLRHDDASAYSVEGEASHVDLLAATREQIGATADARLARPINGGHLEWIRRLSDDGLSPSDADPREATQGPLMGRSPAAVLIEEYRRYALAVEWMRASVLCRVTATSSGATRVALIHDGFGPALERWSGVQEAKSARAVYGLSAQRGEIFGWPSAPSEPPEFDARSEHEPHTLANLRWAGSVIVRTNFRRTVFANCDFRGSIFRSCGFEGVLFVNCLLDGAMFSDCVISGSTSAPPETWEEGETGFMVAGSEAKAAEMAPYFPVESSGPLYSDVPFRPASVAIPSPRPRTIHCENGGLVVQGGRVSMLTCRALAFADGGAIAFRETIGSGLDFVEHGRVEDGPGEPGSWIAEPDPAPIEFTGSLLRHITFTTAPEREEAIALPELRVRVHGSVLVQSWFGDDLHGTLEITDSMLLSMWNGSDPTRLEAAAWSSTYHDLVGVTIDDDTCSPMIDGDRPVDVAPMVAEFVGERPLRDRLLPMDYRRDASDKDVRDRPSDG